MNRLLAQVIAPCTALSTLFSATMAAAPCGTWQPGAGGNGVYGPTNPFVNAMTMWDPDGPGPRPRCLVVGGQFQSAGGTPAANIALWNGTYWEPLGLGIPGGNVFALAQHPSGDLLVGGYFTSAGGVSARYLARWNGFSWSEFAGGTNGTVASIAHAPDGFTYIAGFFTRCNGMSVGSVVRYNGSTWDAMQGGVNSIAHSVRIGSDGSVYLTGQFSHANAIPARGLAKWRNGQWTGYTGMQPEFIYDVFERASGDLAIVGTKRIAGNSGQVMSVPYAALYSNNTWQEIGNIPQTGPGFLTAILEKEGNLTLLGKITHPGGVCATFQQSGPNWNLVPSHVGAAWAAIWDDFGRLVYGGQFVPISESATQPMGHLVAYEGLIPSSFSHGIDGPVLSIATNDQQTVLGGSFISADGVRLNGVCRWNGSGFEAIGPGLDGQVQAVKILPDHSILAGRLATPGTVGSTLSRWDGQSWSNVGGAMSGSVLAVTALANGDIIVGGEPMTVGSLSLNRIGRYSQGTWSSMGTGMNGTVRSLTTLSDQSVIACGDFSVAGGALAFRIAQWSNNSWRPLGSGLGGSVVSAIQDTDGSIIAAGTFIQPIDSNTTLRNVGRWDGAAWRAMGLGLHGQVHSLTKRGNTIIAAGSFSLDGGPANLQLAQWTGTDWAPIASSALDNAIRAVAIAPNGDLIAGGTFLKAENTPTANFAHMRFCIAEFNCDGTTDFFDYLDFVSAFAVSDPRTDLNADGAIDLFDYLDFVEHFTTGC